MNSHRTFRIYAWGVLLFNIGVILWGAYVRATGSGAGCGSHWPLCNSEVIPRPERLETLIEFIHRGSSGVAFLGVAFLAVWAWRLSPPNQGIRFWATLSFAFIITEALVGAGLVLFGLVGENESVARAITIAIHLLNTFLLLACLTLTAWLSSGYNPPALLRNDPKIWLVLIGLSGMIALGMSGAVTALGDTLFPANSLVNGLRQDIAPTANVLIRLRVVHPAIAILVCTYLFLFSGSMISKRDDLLIQRFGRLLQSLILVQLMAGFINLVLLAPVWMQILHLLLSDVLWITLVLFSATLLQPDQAVAEDAERKRTSIFT
jgi:heme A synthase